MACAYMSLFGVFGADASWLLCGGSLTLKESHRDAGEAGRDVRRAQSASRHGRHGC